jgi:hypothetical protein
MIREKERRVERGGESEEGESEEGERKKREAGRGRVRGAEGERENETEKTVVRGIFQELR